MRVRRLIHSGVSHNQDGARQSSALMNIGAHSAMHHSNPRHSPIVKSSKVGACNRCKLHIARNSARVGEAGWLDVCGGSGLESRGSGMADTSRQTAGMIGDPNNMIHRQRPTSPARRFRRVRPMKDEFAP